MKALTLIAAMTPDGVIAVDGKIPWRVSEDMKRFKALTMGHAMVMGRKTYESIGKPLPGRRSIAISRRPYDKPTVSGASDSLEWRAGFDEALASARHTDDSPFVIGGGEIYQLALAQATRLEITIVAKAEHRIFIDGSALTYFPLDGLELYWDFRCVAALPAASDLGVEFLTFERRRS